MKKIILTLLILFVCGMFAADICIQNLVEQNIILSMEVFKEYAYSKIGFKDVIWNMIYDRTKQFLCLLLLRITPLREYIPLIILGILFFCLGFFTMSCVLAIGFVGIVVGLASILPHGLFYAGAYLMIDRKRRVQNFKHYQDIAKGSITYVLMILFFITGCVIECVMGVHFVPWIIRLSFI